MGEENQRKRGQNEHQLVGIEVQDGKESHGSAWSFIPWWIQQTSEHLHLPDNWTDSTDVANLSLVFPELCTSFLKKHRLVLRDDSSFVLQRRKIVTTFKCKMSSIKSLAPVFLQSFRKCLQMIHILKMGSPKSLCFSGVRKHPWKEVPGPKIARKKQEMKWRHLPMTSTESLSPLDTLLPPHTSTGNDVTSWTSGLVVAAKPRLHLGRTEMTEKKRKGRRRGSKRR